MATLGDIMYQVNTGIIEYEKWPEEGQCIGLFDEDGNFQVYTVDRAVFNSATMTKRAECSHLFYELGGGEPRNYVLTNATPATALAAALVGTRWQVGDIDASLTALTEDFDESYISPLAMIRRIESAYEARLSYRCEINHHQVVGLYVDLLAIDEVFKGQRFEFGHDLQNITIDVDRNGVITALVPLGMSDEVDVATGEPKPLTIESVNGGKKWVGDETARLLYGIPDGEGGMRHRFGVYDSEAKTPETLKIAGQVQVQRQSKPKVTIEANIADLEKVKVTDIVTGQPVQLSHNKIRLNNVCQVVARNKGLLAAVEIKVNRIERHIKEPDKTSVELGDPISLGSDLSRALENKLIWQDKRRRELDRGRGSATVTVAMEGSTKYPWYVTYIIPAGEMLNDHISAIQDLLPDNGGQIVLLEGSYAYDADIEISKNNVTLSGQGKGTVITLAAGVTADCYGILAENRTGIKVQDLVIDGNYTNQTGGYHAGVNIDGGSDFYINNVEAKNFRNVGILIGGANNTTSGKIESCICKSNQATGIALFDGTEIIVIGNTAIDNAHHGIYTEDCSDLSIEANNCRRSGQYGIHLLRTTGSMVVNNTTLQEGGTSGYAGIGLFASDKNTVNGNTSNGNGYQGIYLSESDYNTINGNSCSGNGTAANAAGIYLSNTGAKSNHNTVSNNVCEGNATNGITVAGDYNNTQSNKCYDNGFYGVSVSAGATNNIVTNNDLYGNIVGPLVDNGTGTVTSAGNRS